MTATDLTKIKCQYARKCPGCPKIHFVYAKQVADKQKSLETLLAPLCIRSGIKVSPIERSPLLSSYRTTSKLALHQDNFGRQSIGIYERSSKDVVDIPDCPIHDPLINDLVAKIFRRAKAPFPFYNHSKKAFQSGCLKFVTVRLGSSSTEPGIIISHTGVDVVALASYLKAHAPRGASIWACKLKQEDRDLVLTDSLTHISGPEVIPFKAGSLAFELHPASFFQANRSLSGTFLDWITDYHKVAGGETLIDLYGGFGAYSLSVVSHFKKIFLVDGNKEAVASAQRIAASSGITHLKGAAKYCEAFLNSLSTNDRSSVTDIIVNPPRAGLSEQVRKAINRQKFPSLARATYVSCSPETLARDLQAITKVGGRINSVRPFDMFPQTGHLETVVRITF